MSLMLRKQCQELLDEVGLENYHTQVDPDTKMLQIVGECGQDFVSIAGIRLSRMAPNDKEIDLALELFGDFLVKHAESFKNFLKIKAIADNTSIPNTIKGIPSATVEKNNYQSHWELKFELSANKNQSATIKSTGTVTVSSLSLDLVTNPTDVNLLQSGLTSAEAKAIDKWITACKEFDVATKEKEKVLLKLSSCEI